jgi:hypothetical protein
MGRRFFQSDGELNEAIEQLHLLFNENRPFKMTTARKEHIDEFGAMIPRGETYYRRELGWGIANEIKLSRESMERVCGALLFDNPFLIDQLKAAKRPLRSSGEHLPEIGTLACPKFPPRPGEGMRVWSEHGYENHGPAQGPKVDIAPKTGGTVVCTEKPYITMGQLLYVVKWDDGQTSKHYYSGLFCIGRFANYEEFEAGIELQGDIDLKLGPSGGLREARMRIRYDGEVEDVHLDQDDGFLWSQDQHNATRTDRPQASLIECESRHLPVVREVSNGRPLTSSSANLRRRLEVTHKSLHRFAPRCGSRVASPAEVEKL